MRLNTYQDFQSKFEGQAKEIVKKYDRNGDHVIGAEEAQQGVGTRCRPSNFACKSLIPEDTFRAADRNGNGLSADEIAAVAMGRLDRDGDGKLSLWQRVSEQFKPSYNKVNTWRIFEAITSRKASDVNVNQS